MVSRSMAIVLLLFCWIITFAQEEKKQYPKKSYSTKAVKGLPPVLDGSLDDECWKTADWGGDFIQYEPTEGIAPSQPTSFKILYDTKYLYLAFRCHDSEPAKIVRRMSRRDGFEGDWVEINIDSYHDLKTAFSFTASVSGVKGDELVSNDGNNWDPSWNPIWDLKTTIDEEGWTAEARIPLSQLRFANSSAMVWGIQMTRRNFREEERSVWQPIDRNAGYWVSGFGELKGLNGIEPQKQIEIQPYLLGQVETFPEEAGNPFATGFNKRFTAGIDGKIGVTSDLILDFTINPDFGQVEADPSVVVLDGFEVFFAERRPFFIESRNIFDNVLTNSAAGGSYDSDILFYSRRIGGAPHNYPAISASEFVSSPHNTSILGAAKFSGKTKKGLSIGVLESITAKEVAVIDNDGAQREEVVEPFTSYFVGRVQQDLDRGNTIIGGMLTATNRNIEDAQLDGLREHAYSGGLDFARYWQDRSWVFTAKGVFSHVQGSTTAITNTQTGFGHYFQRPDARHLEVDTTLTALTGHAGTLKIGKFGGNMKFETGFTWRSPELELNDIGFMRNSDEINYFAWGGYRINKPFSIFRMLAVNYNHWSKWDFSGRNLYRAVNTNFNLRFNNFWGLASGITYENLDISNTALFGGPALRRPNGIGQWVEAFTDERKKIIIAYNFFNGWGFEQAVRVQEHTMSIRFQPFNALNISLQPNFTDFSRKILYIGNREYNGTIRYIAGAVDQRTFSAAFRFNYSITPDLSLQYYGSPFVSRVRYDAFKYITDPLGKKYADRQQQYSAAQISYDMKEEKYEVDENTDGEVDYSFGNPDFSFIQFRSNLVARWEYIPGSELFFVWSQGETGFDATSKKLFNTLGDNLEFNKIHNIFLVKFTYRFLL